MKSIASFFKSEISKILISSALLISAIIIEATFEFNLAVIIYVLALLCVGAPVFISAVKGILRRDLLDEQFLMSIASIGAMILGDFKEGVAVMLFFAIGEFFQHKAVRKSRNAIRALMDICPDEARVITESGETAMDSEDVEVGSKIIIRPGEKVPIDARIIDGRADVDTSLLTGESIPVSLGIGDEIKSGMIVMNGVLIAETVCDFSSSTASKILELVENANERKSKTENFITAFSHIYTPAVVILALVIGIVPSLFGITQWRDSVYRALTFLVISCPCALVISVPLAFFGGIGASASQGILFKGGNTFSSLARAKAFAFDKTGTLTKGELSVSEVYEHGVSREELLRVLYNVEKNSNHPIAKAFHKLTGIEELQVYGFEEIAGRGTKAELENEICLVGNAQLLLENGVEIPLLDKSGSVFVSRGGKFIGSAKISDKVKGEAKESLSELYRLGIKRALILSGDRAENVEALAKQVGINEFYSSLLPSEKYARLEEISSAESVVYIGDGINDAPSLARADVGIAMGGVGSDIAIESADVVIMTDGLEKLPKAVKIARKTIRIAKQNICFALGVKLAILTLGALGIANMWLAVFADVGVCLLAILNSMRALKFR